MLNIKLKILKQFIVILALEKGKKTKKMKKFSTKKLAFFTLNRNILARSTRIILSITIIFFGSYQNAKANGFDFSFTSSDSTNIDGTENPKAISQSQVKSTTTNYCDALSVFGPRPDYSSGIKPTMIVDEFSFIDNSLTDTRKQQIKNQISAWQADGIKYGAYYGLQTVESELDETIDKGLDLDGSELNIHPITAQGQQDYLINSGKLAIDLGSEYIFLDVAWINAFNSFDEETIENYRIYLSSNYSTEELSTMGVSDIATFNYAQHLRDQGYTNIESLRSNTPEDLLWEAWEQYHHDFERTWFTTWGNTLREYAQRHYGRDLLLGGNRNVYDGNAAWYVADLMDYTLAETFLDNLGYPYHTLSFAYKTSLSLRKRFWSWNFPANTTSLNGTGSDWNQAITLLDQLFTAETFANGGLAQVPMGWVQYLRDNQTVELLIPYYTFALSHPELYNLDNLSEVAILYSEPGESIDPTFKGRSFRGAVGMMEQAHFTYDVVFAGGKYTTDNLVLSALTPYKAIMLPDTRYLTDNQVSVLEEYLSQGGILVGIGTIGDKNEKGESVSRDFSNIFTEGVHSENGGTVIATSEDLFSEHYQAYDGTTNGFAAAATYLADFETLIGDNISRDIVSEISNTVHFSRFVDSNDRSQIYHLVNYDYDMDTYEVRAIQNIEISLTMPEGFDDQTLVISLMSPESPDPEVLTTTINSGVATFSIPELNTWAIIKIGSAASQAIEIDNKPQSMMDLDRLYGGHRPDEKDSNGDIAYNYWYWRDHSPGTSDSIPYLATDDKGLSKVELYYRYSPDEVSWSDWILSATHNYSDLQSVQEAFYVVNEAGEGYYQYQTKATDNADQSESGIFFDELGHGIDITSPDTPTAELVYETNGVISNVGQSTISSPTFAWTFPEDNLSGSLEANVELRRLPPWELVDGKYNVRADDAVFSPGELDQGTYELTMRFVDRAGNWGDGTSVFTFIYQSDNAEIDVQGKGLSISDGDTTPSQDDDTDFGDLELGSGTITHTFTILNLGSNDLNITDDITITNSSFFSIGAAGLTVISGPSGSTNFYVNCNPASIGQYTATVSIPNNDSDENPYNFEVVVNVVESTTGTNDLSSNGIKIYPNPTNSLINLDFGYTEIKHVDVINMTGKTVIQIAPVHQEETIDLSTFDKGVYIIKILTDTDVITKKIMKE